VVVSAGEVVASGLPMGEGPVELPDGSWVTTGVTDGWIWRIDPATGTVERWADTAGGPNSAVVTTDGGLIVAQNGGLDLSGITQLDLGELPPVRYVTPGLQRVRPDGSVSWFVEGLRAPNCLHVTPDGTLWFSDPPPFPADGSIDGRVVRCRPDGTWDVWAEGFGYDNGLIVEADGAVLVCELGGLLRMRDPHDRTWLVEDLGSPGDGLCLDVEGNIYLSGTDQNVVRVVSPTGELLEVIEMPVSHGVVNDVAFVGPDRTTLVALVGQPGVLVAWEGRPVAGQPLVPFAVS
jgi:gluconolactonase